MTQLFPERRPQPESAATAVPHPEDTHGARPTCDMRIAVPLQSGVRALSRNGRPVDQRAVAESPTPESEGEGPVVEPELRQIVRLAVAALVGLCLAAGAVVVASALQLRPTLPSAPLHAVSPRLGILSVRIATGAARVYVDGRELGPAPVKLLLPEGPHLVRIAAASGAAPLVVPLEIAAGTAHLLEIPPVE